MDGSEEITELVGYVVPTLGKRPELLSKCLSSLRRANVDLVYLVCPGDVDLSTYVDTGFVDKILVDPGGGLAAAINKGIRALPNSVSFVGWLGDDDYLLSESVEECVELLSRHPSNVLVFGSCRYVDINDQKVWRNKSGQFASKLLLLGPCLIPQPGSLFKRSAFVQIGDLNEKLGWAFDLDLFIRLSKVGRLLYIKRELAAFRWHEGSLTVSLRRKSVAEASSVRVSHLSRLLRPFSVLWEPIIRAFTFHAQKLIRNQ